MGLGQQGPKLGQDRPKVPSIASISARRPPYRPASPATGPFTGRLHSLRLEVYPGAELVIVGRASLTRSTGQARSHQPTLVAPLPACISRQALLGQCDAAPARVPASSGDDCGSSPTRVRIFSINDRSGMAAMMLTCREADGRERRLAGLRECGCRLYGYPPRPAGSGRCDHGLEDPSSARSRPSLHPNAEHLADLEIVPRQ